MPNTWQKPAARSSIGATGFIDLNFGCPVNKVVAKMRLCFTQGLPDFVGRRRRCRKSGRTAPRHSQDPHRLGADSVNAVRVARLLVDLGITAITVHGRRARRVTPARPIGMSSVKLPQRFRFP